MTDFVSRSYRRPQLRQRAAHSPLLWPLTVFGGAAFAALLFIAYVLWPRWPDPVVVTDAPALPVTVAGVAFNIPPAAMRVPVQRRPGGPQRAANVGGPKFQQFQGDNNLDQINHRQGAFLPKPHQVGPDALARLRVKP